MSLLERPYVGSPGTVTVTDGYFVHMDDSFINIGVCDHPRCDLDVHLPLRDLDMLRQAGEVIGAFHFACWIALQ